jgi:hypothetical protein
MIKSRRMRWAQNFACMVRIGLDRNFWWESQKERDHYQDLDVGGRIILQ